MNIKGDFSSAKDSKYAANFMQQGRVLLDADYNENVRAFLNMMWKESKDMFGEAACLGDSFRIGTDIPIDHMVEPKLWEQIDTYDGKRNNDHSCIFLNTSDVPCPHPNSRYERGSLYVEKTNGIQRKFNKLDLSKFRYIFVRFKFLESMSEEDEKDLKKDSLLKLNIKLALSSSSSQQQTIDENTTHAYLGQIGEFDEHDAGGFYQVKFDILQSITLMSDEKKQETLDLSNIAKLSITWGNNVNGAPIIIGLISGEPFVTVVGTDTVDDASNWITDLSSYSSVSSIYPTSSAASEKNFNLETFNHKPTIRKRAGLNQLIWEFSNHKNFNGLNLLRFALSNIASDCMPLLFILDSNGKKAEFSATKENDLSNQLWSFYTVNLEDPKKQARTEEDERDDEQKEKQDFEYDLSQIKTIGLENLPEKDLYVSEILGEINFKNDFIVSGDFALNHAARMYVGGIPCDIDNWETYLNQKNSLYVSDIVASSPPFPPLSKDGHASKRERSAKNSASLMVYCDVWHKGVTHIEDPTIREIALGGPDTTTKIITICQIKVKELANNVEIAEKIRIAKDELANIKQYKSCRLSTFNGNFDSNATAIGNPYDHSSSRGSSSSSSRPGDYNGNIVNPSLENSLYRIQIHDSGINIDDKSTFKWSRNNASTTFKVKKVYEFEVTLENANRNLNGIFKIGDLIEIIDDVDELSEQPKGQLRRITDIDMSNKKLSWGQTSNPDYTASSFSGKMHLHDAVKTQTQTGKGHHPRYHKENHPKIVLWDGVQFVNSKIREQVEKEEHGEDNSVTLYDSSSSSGSIRVRFDPGVFQSGDYWSFTTRASGQIEQLRSAFPKGPNHEYALLGLVKKEDGGNQIKIMEDLRLSFSPFVQMKAIDILYDDDGYGGSSQSGHKTVQSALQNLFENRVQIIGGQGNDSDGGGIGNLYMESGEIYELEKNQHGSFSKKIDFKRAYQSKPLLIYGIKSDHKSQVSHKIRMNAFDKETGKTVKDTSDDLGGKRSYLWKEFEVESDKNATIIWVAIGESNENYERYSKPIMDEIFKILFGANLDDLQKDDGQKIIDSWFKQLEQFSGQPDVGKQARNNWKNFVKKLKTSAAAVDDDDDVETHKDTEKK